VRFNSVVIRVMKDGDRVTGVGLADGSVISADLVVNAAGPWCNQLNAVAGVDLRWTLTPTRVQVVYRPWPSELGPIPVGADASTGIYFRPESAGQTVLVGSVLAEDEEEVVDDPDDFKRVPDPGFTEMKLAAFHHRVPALEARGRLSGIAGLYTINREDVHPVVGPSGVEGFWVANGFSGHGFKLAPSIGSMVAQEVTGRTMEFDTDVPMRLFSAEREPMSLAVKSVLA
jgi:glycine/D-amino acid oxidase-like deaminating enzyme